MVTSNTERISRALGFLRDGLGPVCERTWSGFYGNDWLKQVNSRLHSPAREPSADYDVAFLLSGMKATWEDVFNYEFRPAVRPLVFEVAEARNSWAHQKPLSSDDTLRWLDSMERLLGEFGNSIQRQQICDLRYDLIHQMADQQPRTERRRATERPTKSTPQSIPQRSLEGQTNTGTTVRPTEGAPQALSSAGRYNLDRRTTVRPTEGTPQSELTPSWYEVIVPLLIAVIAFVLFLRLWLYWSGIVG